MQKWGNFENGVADSIPAYVSEKLNERYYGKLQGLNKEEAKKTFGEAQVKLWRRSYDIAPPGGESLAKMTERVRLFLNMIFERRNGQKVLLVTHGGTIRCIRALLEHWNYERATSWPMGESPKNCGVTVYNFDSKEQRLILGEYNTIYY